MAKAAGSKTGSRSVLFSWRTDAPTSGQLTLYPSASPTQTITRTTPLSRVHTLLVEDLSRNTQYTWWVDSASPCGQATSPERTFSVGNGIVFVEHNPPPFDIHRDYGQLIPLTLRNEDSLVTHTLRLTVEHPYADLIAGFVGPGSVDDGAEYISLAPDATQVITLAIHAQDAEQVNYDLTAQVIADEDSPGNEIVDYAHLSVRVLRANNYTMTLVSEDLDTLVKTYQVKNLGLPITDLRVQALDPATGLPARALIQPTLHHARLGKAGDPDDTLTFQVIPLFSPDDAIALQALSRMGAGGGLASPLPQVTDFDINVVATVLDTVQELVGSYVCQGDAELYAVTLHNVWANYFNDDWYCTNRPSIDLDFPVPGNINVADILSATVSTSLSPRSAGVQPHDVQILFNGNQVGELLDQVPDGSYTFSVDPAFFNPSANPVQPVNQTLGLRTYHFNGGHYVVNTSSRLDLPLANYTRYVCAANPQEARDKAGQGFWPIPTQVDIQIVQPQAGAQLELGWPVVLEATVDDGHESYIYYPVLARIVYSDQPQDVKTVMLVPYSSSGTVDTYRGYWLPARLGEVSITQTVYAGIVTGSDNVVVTVEPQATFSISGQVTWTESGNSISGVAIRPAQGSAPFGEVQTDERGNYQIVDLPRGSYELTASREGYTFVDAANPNQSTIQVQITEMDVSGKDFIAVSEPPPTIPDAPDGEVFKGAGWLRFDDDTDATNYANDNIHWNVELSEDIIERAGLPAQIETFATGSANVDTLIRLDDLERRRRNVVIEEPREVVVNDRGPLPFNSPLWPNVLAQNDCSVIEDWMVRIDQHYEDVIRLVPSVDKFILANEPNHATDEWNYTAEQYAFVFDCYYIRWLEHEFEEGVGRRPHALYVAGPGQEAGRTNYQWQDFLPAEFNNIDRTDGFAMHVYGYAAGAGDVYGNDLFKQWLDRIMANMNNYSNSLPLIISEYNPGATPGNVNEPADWEEWFERTYCWTLSAQQTYPNVQLRGLIYYVDEPSPSRDPDPQWDPVSLRRDETNRRQVWLNLDNDFTGFGFAPSADNNYRNWCLDGSGASMQNNLANLYISISDDMIQFPQNSPLLAVQSSPSQQIGGVISGTLGVWGDSTVYYVTDDLEIPTGQTLTIEAGTTLVFSPTQRMVVAGQLQANGNTVFPVRFISPNEAGWEGIQIQASAVNSWCTGCSLENIRANGVALQVEAPFAFRGSFIHNVPGGTAISTTVPMTLTHVVIDYVDTGIHLSGQPGQTHSISHVTLNRCERGVVNQGQTLTLDNSIITTCSVAFSTELTGTTAISYMLFHGNGQNFATEAGSTLTQGPGLLNGPPGFVNFPTDVTLRADSLAVNAADPQAPYNRELGYNGGRADLGAYGNSWRAPQQPPLDQMGVSLVTDTPSLNGLPGEALSYTLTLQNSGSVTDTYGIVVQPSDFRFDTSFVQDYNEDYFFAELTPQGQISVTLWVRIPLTSTLSPSNTIAVKAVGRYGVQSETELTLLISSFQEANGQVVMEAEHFSGRTDHGSRIWLTQTVLSGYSGTGYLTASPDTDLQFTTAYTTNSPELAYTLNFTTTGVYTVWLRGYAPNGAGDSVYMGLDNQPVAIVTQFAPRAWTWTRTNTQGNPVTVEITQPGLHTLHLWQREDGLRVDKILLTTDGEYNPSGNGPPESEIR